ncbi:GntR family transcriptional regulator, transcriptional repressor for pyruvate dehydrogenase complex [Oryzomicrobium terrae]|uniref:Pyruvate dehydrogenase complex repressor n=1 Tax=Oryzomicrobium terrae TaxID=1735038 RepID=A0A5C1E7Y7_9RHOO|nr:FCD domain-containing protein [Oryzomicrobium terrae]QEL65040.1 GntR family transcriptional regulator, transcriptional repressor for pyruvate dehydrogenase complex [Oryzomicrobium terrae]
MPAGKIAVQRLSDTIAHDLERRILEGSLKPGDRLQPERELAAELGVSRPSLREAIQKLVSKGLLHSRQGGGTYVTDQLDAAFTDPWQQMLRLHPNIQADLLEFRGMLESEAASLAARRATDADLLRIGQAYERVEALFAEGPSATVFEEQVTADLAFHQAIAEAAHNVMFGHLTASLFRVTHDHIDRNLRHLRRMEEDWLELRDQHAAIWEAIRTRNPQAAHGAVRRHIDFVRESMLETAQHEERETRALRRLK